MSATHIGHKFSFTSSFSEAVVPVGTTYDKHIDGQVRSYVFCLVAGADTTAAGDVVCTFSASAWTYGSVSVTAATISDFTDATSTRPLVAGIAGCAAANGAYLWLWYSGPGTHSITTDGNVAVYNELITTDGAKIAVPNTTAASAHFMHWGKALAADVSTTLSSAILGGPGMAKWMR